MAERPLSVSTDQVAAFVELAKYGSLHGAAESLHITEQAVRNRLLVLEERLGTELYLKGQGGRRAQPLTEEGRRLLPKASAFLESGRELGASFAGPVRASEIHVAASQYFILYLLIDAVREFHRAFPQIQIRLTSRNAREIEETLLSNPTLAFGVAAPFDSSPQIHFRHLFSMTWALITPLRHELAHKRGLRLDDLANAPLILFERGSSGRKRVVDAFHARGLSPRVEMETTNTEILIRMVEAGLGLSIIPMMHGAFITRGRQVAVRPLDEHIAPLPCGILTRRGEQPSKAAEAFLAHLVASTTRGSGRRPGRSRTTA